MHSIKSAARRQAWYHNNDPDNRTYNIYGRTNSNLAKKQRDEEMGPPVERIVTESDAGPSPIETRRRQQYGASDFGAPKKAGTFPDTAPGSRNGGVADRGFEKSRDMDVEAVPSRENTSKDSHGTDVTRVPEQETEKDTETLDRGVGPEDGPRKRKLRKFLPFAAGKPIADNIDEERTPTDQDVAKKRKKGEGLTVMSQVKAVFLSWVNIMLIFVPVGIALEYAIENKVIVFVINFLAIIPLANALSFGTEESALYVGETLGGLLNASFGNAVELIVSIIALQKGKILIVQTSLIGSMLSNLLLVLGMCFFFGGIRRKEQFFNVTVAQTAASLLALAIGGLIVPTAFRIFSTNDKGVDPTSRGTAIIMLLVYGCYLLFQLKTHTDMYNEPSQKAPKISSGKRESGEALRGLATMGAGTAAASGGSVNQTNLMAEQEEEEEMPQLTRLGALITLAGSTVLVALCAEYMVSSIDAISGAISPEFIGLILLPIVGNAAEHATAVTVAIKDKMDLAIGVAVGSSLQIALLVLPLMVIIGWIGLGQPEDMTLDFDGFQIAVLFISVLLVNYLIGDGKSHWLEGIMLMAVYIIIAVAAFFYPAADGVAG